MKSMIWSEASRLTTSLNLESPQKDPTSLHFESPDSKSNKIEYSDPDFNVTEYYY